LAIEVAPLERDPLVRSEPCLGGEDDQRPEGGPELERERIDLLEREGQELLEQA
jgi:hypothetical protein